MGSLLRPGNEAAGSLELGDELGDRRYGDRAAVDPELAGLGIDPARRDRPGRVRRLRRLEDREAEVHAVAAEETGEALAHHLGHAPGPECLHDVLPGGAEAEVPAGDEDRVRPEPVAKRWVVAVEEVPL